MIRTFVTVQPNAHIAQICFYFIKFWTFRKIVVRFPHLSSLVCHKVLFLKISHKIPIAHCCYLWTDVGKMVCTL